MPFRYSNFIHVHLPRTICGLPFKKLDKKLEKQYLFSRRKALTEALAATTDARAVLELTIMLLFHQVNAYMFKCDQTTLRNLICVLLQVKGLVVSGPHLTGPILHLLQKEKKITDEVSKLLQDLAESVNSESDSDEALAAAVKACGMSRDISKHMVA
jgi:hypothetical protein